MRYTLSTHGVVLSAFNRRQIEEKAARLSKYLQHPLPIEITLRREGKGLITCGVTYGEGKRVLHAERSHQSLEAGLDEALEALKKEIIRTRERSRA
ncbi:MAG: HPF/RaiA family ribosome-associated protein [Patescibacteria group bacterium]